MKHVITFAIAVALSAACLLPTAPAYAQWELLDIVYSTTVTGPELVNASATGYESPSSPEASMAVSAYYDGSGSRSYSGTIVTTYDWVGGGNPPSQQLVDQNIYANGYSDSVSYAVGS